MSKAFGTPGARGLHPSMATSASVAACSLPAQLLFARLIPAADDQGRQLGDPLLVKASCMPIIVSATPAKIRAWLTELEAQGMIHRYTALGTSLLQIVRWWDYQAGMRHAWPSRWPGPEGWTHDQFRGHGLKAGDPAGTPQGPDGGTLSAKRRLVPMPVPMPYAGAEPVPAARGFDSIVKVDA